MPILEIFKQTIAALWHTKLRSFLTMFGIVWGIMSVILLVGLGIGFGIDQGNRMKSLGTDIAICFPGKTSMPSGGYAADRVIMLKTDDAIAIQQLAPLVKNVSPELAANRKRSQPMERGKPRRSRGLAGVSEFSIAQARIGTTDDRGR